MNKEQFLSELSRRLDGLCGNELYRTLEYYAEMIDDRMEEGMSEEAAVAALGDVERIAREIAQESPSREQARPAEDGASEGSHRQTFSGELRRIQLDSQEADFLVRGAALPEGTCCAVENAQELRCRMEDGVLVVSDAERSGGFLERIFSRFAGSDQPVTVLLPERVRCDMEIRSKSGDVQLERFALDGGACIESLSGDLSVSSMSAAGELTLKSMSGDLSACECRALRLSLKSASGDIRLQSIEAETGVSAASVSGDVTVEGANLVDELTCQSASGDVQLRSVSAERIAASSTSGDVSVQNTVSRTDMELSSVSGDAAVVDSEAQQTLTARSTSGDVRLRSASAAQLTLESRSGDIGGSLRGPESLYEFRCHSRAGDVRVPDCRGERLVEARTSSGDIRLRAE